MVSCNEHDYIEIACMYNYPIRISLRTGEAMECTALDTQYNEDRQECIKVDIKGTEILVVINDISDLEITIENPHFKDITFGG